MTSAPPVADVRAGDGRPPADSRQMPAGDTTSTTAPSLEPRSSLTDLRSAAVTARTLGTVVAVTALTEMVAWHLHLTALLRVRDSYNPIVFNTALALLVTGVAVGASTHKRTAALRVAATVDVVFGAINLIEELTGRSLGLDQLFIRAYVMAPGRPPGRIAPNIATCLIVLGLALLVWRPLARGWRAHLPMWAAVVVGGIAAVALFGQMSGLSSAYGWAGLAMPLPTAIAMCMLASALLALSLSARDSADAPVGVWVAVPAGLGAFGAAGLIWQAMVETTRGADVVSASAAMHGALLLALLSGLLFAMTTWLAQRASSRRYEALALTAALRVEIDRRTEAERAARDSHHLMRSFLDALPVAVLVVSPGPTPFLVNRAAQAMTGHGVEPVAGPEQLAAVYDLYLAGSDLPYPMERSPLLRGLCGEVTHVDDLEARPSQDARLLEAWGTPVFDDDGEVAYSLAVYADITERRAMEREVAEKAALLDLSRDAIFITDPQRRITYWNQGAATAYGWTREEAEGQDSTVLLRTELPCPIAEAVATLRLDGHWQGEIVNHTRAGGPITVISEWMALRGPSGVIQSVAVINTDVTSLKQAQAELQVKAQRLEQRNVELNRSNEDLTQFAYAASHDLAEPLRAISGPVSLIARRYRGQLDEDADAFIDFAVDGCNRMQILIDDILAYSRVGRFDGDLADVDVAAVLTAVLDGLRPTLDQRKATICVGHLPTLHAAPTEVRQLMQNLVCNAVKFTPAQTRPRVAVDAEQRGEFWRFTVTDNGIGIDPKYRDRIFGMFKRLHTREEYPGTGIGLALAKKIVERHSGEIGVDDGPDGTGCTFWFTLPIEMKRPT